MFFNVFLLYQQRFDYIFQEALFAFNPPKKVESRTHLQLGQLLFTYTNNIDLAKSHLEHAYDISHDIRFDDIRLI